MDKLVYEAYPSGDGCFDEDEREVFLTAAKEAIARYWTEEEEVVKG